MASSWVRSLASSPPGAPRRWTASPWTVGSRGSEKHLASPAVRGPSVHCLERAAKASTEAAGGQAHKASPHAGPQTVTGGVSEREGEGGKGHHRVR